MTKKKVKLNLNKVIKQYYNNPSNPGAFSGLNSLYRELKIKLKNQLRFSDLQKWARTQNSYTLHKPKQKKIKRNTTIVSGIDDTWQIDLCDLRSLKKENDNFSYILTVIDVFSKKAWAFKLKNKTGPVVLEAFKSLVEKRKPERVHSDEGNEFLNRQFKSYLKNKGINLYVTNSDMKASIVERFNRTLKEKMWRYFTFTGSMRYIDVLDKIVESYNNTYHRSIKSKPNKVNKSNRDKIFLNLYGFNSANPSESYLYKAKFKIGDYVRLSKDKNIFEKGYTSNWTREIFIISQILFLSIPTYIVKDLKDEQIEGIFYEKELQKVDINSE